MADTYKALTFINLPFAGEDGQGKAFAPGEEISRADFEANAENEFAPDADEEIANMIESGAISEDLDAPLHPDHIPPNPAVLSLGGVVNAAQTLMDQMSAQGREVPEELQNLAELDITDVVANDSASASDKESS